ncbi:MAG: hypothetical protein ACRENH_08325 [Gemmatimonadaceae bacterium]
MKYVVWLVSALNVYLGLRAFLNAIGVLQTSKYSQAATVIFAILFLGLGAAGFYVTIARNNPKLGMLVAVGPWLLAIVVLFITMITSDYK